jgi:DNA recombination protein RmuC
MSDMQAPIVALIVALLVVLIGAVFYALRQISKWQNQTDSSALTQTATSSEETAKIIAAIRETLNVPAFSSGVQGAVETKIYEAAIKVLQDANNNARELADERLQAQSSSLEEQARRLMQPFESQMTKLNEEVTKLREQNADKFSNVDSAVAGLVRQTQTLNNVLSSAQGRGSWGERMLEDILSQSGFERGINYEKQEILEDGGKPDFSFFLPPDRVLYLDSKFPIDNYKAYFEANDDASRNLYRDQFIKNVEDRVKELERRDYTSQSSREAIDYVLLFIPNESVLSFIQQHKPGLVDDAVKKKVVLCSPLTLYAFLGVVRQATDSFHMQKNANEVLSLLTQFSKAWKSYTKYLVDIQKHFDKIQDKLKAVTTGRVMSNLRVPLIKVEDLAKKREIEGSDETLKEITAAFEASDDNADDDLED